jgi:4-amino-4-deoxy-L-arabinose transferase-like glycosyltransferase
MLKINWRSNRLVPIIIWLVAIAIRLYGATKPAQLYDIGTFEAWSRSFWTYGPKLFFGSVWSDYTPLPILSFAPISVIADLFHASFGTTFKLIHIFIELLLIFLISKTISKNSLLSPISYLLLLSPALIGDNAFWGQVDTIPALMALLSLTTGSPILLGFAVAYKPIMILVAPALWVVSLKNKESWWKFPAISAIVFFITAIPTGGINFFRHMFDRIFAQAGTYPYLSVNAFNLWSLSPTNSWINDATSVLGISGRTLGFVIFILLSVITLNYWRKSKFSPKFAMRVAATTLILFFTFTTRMHERHLLFGLPFLTLAIMAESWLIIPLALLTLTFTLNLYGAYYWVNHAQTWPFGLPIISLISWVTVITTICLSLIWNWPQFLKKLRMIISANKLIISILVLSAFLRIVSLAHPSTYIFDEVYHAFTSREYLAGHIEAWEWWTTPPEGVAYEWTHPPVAKYGMVIGMLLFGENSFGWRVGSATFGVLSILGLYLLVAHVTQNKRLALISAFLVSIEGLHISQSRIAMNDMYMLCFYIWALFMAVKSRWKHAAILFGLALASKWSALYGIIPLAIIYLSQVKLTLRSIIYVIRLLIISLFIYILSFAPFILAGHTWAQWWELHRQMWYYHTHLVATHAYQSTPLQWIFTARPVWYFVHYGETSIANIYAQGNPLIMWLGLVAFIFQLKTIRSFKSSLFYILALVFTLPWIFSPRIMFFYHYLPSSVFLCVILASWLNTLPQKYIRYVLILFVLSLIIISPVIYGFNMPSVYWNTLFHLFPTWK